MADPEPLPVKQTPTPTPLLQRLREGKGREPSVERQTSQSTTLVKSTQFSGPIPPPELLREYEQICPGYADRILKAVEREAEHRREMEGRMVASHIRRDDKQFSEAKVGQLCAWSIVMSALIAGAYTALHGHEIAGSVIGASGITGIVTTFIWGRQHRQHSSARQTGEQEPPTEKTNNVPQSTPERKKVDSGRANASHLTCPDFVSQ